ncbi:hypothetical protein AVEN_199271-1 [Araneus ventricosus]|uniref:Reverse transcriptase/retrotransposon-derived protein RNase H-like domain-containing protein n=1 Tax=Araneus ventricosus TaxID=182803 RepID=A0A4Y2K1A6_ARAVE|nr:hypothetical protein AVEN_199271-1 [Araneus ventricosus]
MKLPVNKVLTGTLKGKLRQGKINWTEECTSAFKELKDKLSQQPILYAPDFNKEFKLQTDASNSGMGVILANKDDNDKEHPVLYLSKKFSETEKSILHCKKFLRKITGSDRQPRVRPLPVKIHFARKKF